MNITIKLDGEVVDYRALEQHVKVKIEDETNYKEKTKEEYAESSHFYLATKLTQERLEILNSAEHIRDAEKKEIEWQKAEVYREETLKLVTVGYKENPNYWEELYFQNADVKVDVLNKKSLITFMFHASKCTLLNYNLLKQMKHPKVSRSIHRNYADDWGMQLRFLKLEPFYRDSFPPQLKDNTDFLWFVIENINRSWSSLPDKPEYRDD